MPDVYENLSLCRNCLLATGWYPTDPYDAYTSIFSDLYPESEYGKYSDFSHPQPICLIQRPRNNEDVFSEKKIFTLHPLFSDTLYDLLDDSVLGYGTCLCSGISYHGKTNRFSNAQRMHALIIDVDSVGLPQLQMLLERMQYPPEKAHSIPLPSLVCLSGTGVHLYYVFKEPLELFPNVVSQLKAFKYYLETRISEYGITSCKENTDHLPLNQSFRMIGSQNPKYGTIIEAYRPDTDIPTVTMEDLNRYADKIHRVNLQKPFSNSKMTKEEARERYPEWAKRVLDSGISASECAKWHINPALYRWWREKLPEATGGHRYFFMLALAAFAVKCDIPREVFLHDLHNVYLFLRQVPNVNPITGKTDPLTIHDEESAIEAYDRGYFHMSRQYISDITGIVIPPNPHRRPPESRMTRTEAAKFARETLAERNKDEAHPLQGRPDKRLLVQQWRKKHPDGTQSECLRDLGLSRSTIHKWWDV